MASSSFTKQIKNVVLFFHDAKAKFPPGLLPLPDLPPPLILPAPLLVQNVGTTYFYPQFPKLSGKGGNSCIHTTNSINSILVR